MIAVYGRQYGDRYQAITDLIPAGASVLDLCCGPGILYQRYLRRKKVNYTGLDINEKFVRNVISYGAQGRVQDLCSDDPLPEADYVVMQASLYHFLPNAAPIVSRMVAAARSAVIIAEPIRNLSNSRLRPLSWLARNLTNPGSGAAPLRFNEATLTELFSQLDLVESKTFLAGGGRERLYVFSAD
jgi:SAM-dependent methyltransferase